MLKRISDSRCLITACALSLLLAAVHDYLPIVTIYRMDGSRLYALFSWKRMYPNDSDRQPLQIIHADGYLSLSDIDPEAKGIWKYDQNYVLYHYKY